MLQKMLIGMVAALIFGTASAGYAQTFGGGVPGIPGGNGNPYEYVIADE
jgi:hypothetical protein